MLPALDLRYSDSAEPDRIPELLLGDAAAVHWIDVSLPAFLDDAAQFSGTHSANPRTDMYTGG